MFLGWVSKGLTAPGLFFCFVEVPWLAGFEGYEVPTWSQIYDLTLFLAQKIRSSGYRPQVIVGIIRGGMVPARVLADLLEVQQVATIQVEFYVNIGKTAAEPVLKQGLAVPVAGKRVLLVDDIADSGKSLQLALNYLQNQGAAEIRSATLYYKRKSVVEPSFFEKETGCWVVFPWETRETLREIINSHKGKRDVNHAVAKLVKSGLPQHLADTLLASMQEEQS
jgi:uncharacterized protein